MNIFRFGDALADATSGVFPPINDPGHDVNDLAYWAAADAAASAQAAALPGYAKGQQQAEVARENYNAEQMYNAYSAYQPKAKTPWALIAAAVGAYFYFK